MAYVDGSYHIGTKEFSCGAVLFLNGEELHFSERFTDPDLAEMRNVAGEIKGSETVLRYCIEHDVPSVTIYHDYEGVAKWATGEWKAKKPGTIAYREFCAAAAKHIRFRFVKVKGHSGDKYNDLADRLAKDALGIQ
ncbi:RNase H family protein [Hominenteromicrobium sp.]|uniref:RNase H family protein n=1 Tax=Hominenteromicrobium sp. TaxID=3073581 RepID=UPI00399A76DD